MDIVLKLVIHVFDFYCYEQGMKMRDINVCSNFSNFISSSLLQKLSFLFLLIFSASSSFQFHVICTTETPSKPTRVTEISFHSGTGTSTTIEFQKRLAPASPASFVNIVDRNKAPLLNCSECYNGPASTFAQLSPSSLEQSFLSLTVTTPSNCKVCLHDEYVPQIVMPITPAKTIETHPEEILSFLDFNHDAVLNHKVKFVMYRGQGFNGSLGYEPSANVKSNEKVSNNSKEHMIYIDNERNIVMKKPVFASSEKNNNDILQEEASFLSQQRNSKDKKLGYKNNSIKKTGNEKTIYHHEKIPVSSFLSLSSQSKRTVSSQHPLELKLSAIHSAAPSLSKSALLSLAPTFHAPEIDKERVAYIINSNSNYFNEAENGNNVTDEDNRGISDEIQESHGAPASFHHEKSGGEHIDNSDGEKKNGTAVEDANRLELGLAETSVPIMQMRDSQYVGILGVGTPPQYVSPIFDTGSTNLWVVGSECKDATCTKVTQFDHQKSSTFHFREPRVHLDITFGTGCIEGNTAKDNFKVGPFIIKDQTFGLVERESGHNEHGNIFRSINFEGIVGLAFPDMSSTGDRPIYDSIMDQATLKKNEFAFYVANKSPLSALFFGGVDPRFYKAPIHMFPVTKEHYWEVELDAIHVGDEKFCCEPNSKNYVILDSGTSFNTVPGNEIEKFLSLIPTKECPLDNPEALKSYPVIKYTISGVDFELDPTEYLVRTKNDLCKPAYMQIDVPSEYGHAYILGSVAFMRHFYTVFRRAENNMPALVGIAKAQHSEENRKYLRDVLDQYPQSSLHKENIMYLEKMNSEHSNTSSFVTDSQSQRSSGIQSLSPTIRHHQMSKNMLNVHDLNPDAVLQP